MSVRSMYTYIDKGLFTARNVDLKRQTKFKPRKYHKTQIKDREVFTNRTYADFCSLELNSYVQMDTVKSSRDSKKTLLTMIFTKEKLDELYKKEKTSRTLVKPPKVGRNDPCPCGSGKKYKKCCGR